MRSMDDYICSDLCAVPAGMTLLHLLRQVRRFYPLLSVYDLLIAGLEELLYQNRV